MCVTYCGNTFQRTENPSPLIPTAHDSNHKKIFANCVTLIAHPCSSLLSCCPWNRLPRRNQHETGLPIVASPSDAAVKAHDMPLP